MRVFNASLSGYGLVHALGRARWFLYVYALKGCKPICRG